MRSGVGLWCFLHNLISQTLSHTSPSFWGSMIPKLIEVEEGPLNHWGLVKALVCSYSFLSENPYPFVP